jgi:hypothetical protein
MNFVANDVLFLNPQKVKILLHIAKDDHGHLPLVVQLTDRLILLSFAV